METGGLQEAVQRALFEAEPDVGVEIARFFKRVLGEVEDQDLATGFEDAVGFGHGALRVLGVVERLAEDREVHGSISQRDVFDVAEFVGEVGEAVFGGELRADFDHARRIINTPDLGGALGEELRDETLAGAEVGDGDRRGEAQGEVADGFPRAAGAIVFPEPAGDEVKILFLRAAALLEDALEVGAVFGELGERRNRGDSGAQQGEDGGAEVGAEGVKRFFALAAVGDEAGLAEERELGRDARLAHAEDLLELGDGELLMEHEGEQAQAGGVGEGFEDVPRSVHKEGRWGNDAAWQWRRRGIKNPTAGEGGRVWGEGGWFRLRASRRSGRW